MEKNIILARHAESAKHAAEDNPVSELYDSLTQGGVSEAKSAAEEVILPTIMAAPDGTVFYICGGSDQQRTLDTGRVIGDTLKGEDGLIVFQDNIEDLVNTGSISDALKSDSRVVITNPLLIKEFAYSHNNRWTDNSGRTTEYFKKLREIHCGDKAMVHWIQNNGTVEIDGKTFHGNSPEQVAREYLTGINRVYEEIAKNISGRKLITLAVGHRGDLDAVASYTATGKVNSASFDQVSGGRCIQPAESMQITLDNNRATLNYRGKKFNRRYKK